MKILDKDKDSIRELLNRQFEDGTALQVATSLIPYEIRDQEGDKEIQNVIAAQNKSDREAFDFDDTPTKIPPAAYQNLWGWRRLAGVLMYANEYKTL